MTTTDSWKKPVANNRHTTAVVAALRKARRSLQQRTTARGYHAPTAFAIRHTGHIPGQSGSLPTCRSTRPRRSGPDAATMTTPTTARPARNPCPNCLRIVSKATTATRHGNPQHSQASLACLVQGRAASAHEARNDPPRAASTSTDNIGSARRCIGTASASLSSGIRPKAATAMVIGRADNSRICADYFATALRPRAITS